MSNFITVMPSRGGAHNIPSDKPAMTIGRALPGSKKGGALRHVYTINQKLMERLRWVAGDKVVVAVDVSARLVKITRSPNGTYTLSPRSRDGAGKPRVVDSGFTFPALPCLAKSRVGNFIEEGGSIIVEWKD